MGTKRTVSTKDAQPSAVGSGAIVVFVTGEWAGQLYQETFQLGESQLEWLCRVEFA